jgi:NAD(P)-dependent dehydrogenase (short-subunit alcohol dehydrogenase family)
MMERRRGCIITLASVQGLESSQGMSGAYGASKAGVILLTKNLASDSGLTRGIHELRAGVMSITACQIHGAAAPHAYFMARARDPRSDYGLHGIRCNAICPGYIETPMTSVLRQGCAGTLASLAGIAPIPTATAAMLAAPSPGRKHRGPDRPGGRRLTIS